MKGKPIKAGLNLQKTVFNRLCSVWATKKMETIPDDVIESLLPCPPSLHRAQLPIIFTCSGSAGQQCCYNDTGNLVVGSPNGGFVNCFAPVDLDSFYKHIEHDVIPNVYCCPDTCASYYMKRPSDNGNKYRPP